MELFFEFHYERNGKQYNIQILQTPLRQVVEVHLAGSPEVLYTYPLSIKGWDNPDPRKLRAYSFFACARAFDYVNAIA